MSRGLNPCVLGEFLDVFATPLNEFWVGFIRTGACHPFSFCTGQYMLCCLTGGTHMQASVRGADLKVVIRGRPM